MVNVCFLQLPEPIVPFRLYNRLMGLAKDSLQGEADTAEGEEGGTGPAVGRGPELVDLGPDTEPEVLVLVDSLKELLKEIPKANFATLRYITRHLRRIAELEEDNKMSPSNLGIVFGPSLMRPRPTGATISLSSLVDYPHQARIVEALVVFYSSIFQAKTSQSKSSRSTQQESVTREKVESTGDGEDVSKDENKPDSDKPEEGCGSSLGSLGSSEQFVDSDSDESCQRPCSLMKQESVVSMDEDQLSYRDSLDLSSHSAIHTDQEQDTELDTPEVLDSRSPDDDDAAAEQDVTSSLAELNMNQSNNNQASTSILGLSGLPLTQLSGKNLPLTRKRDTEPEFV
uniref:Histocompatibility (Minor) HA-1 n=1 Tax=Nothobranchius korthausae TaxID=1143690 RepID=A0A1A8EY84_9TELE